MSTKQCRKRPREEKEKSCSIDRDYTDEFSTQLPESIEEFSISSPKEDSDLTKPMLGVRQTPSAPSIVDVDFQFNSGMTTRVKVLEQQVHAIFA